MFIEVWDLAKPERQNLAEFRNGNILGKRSRARTEDALAILRQRFVSPGLHVIGALKSLSAFADAFRDACYFEAARNDDLLAYTAGTVLGDIRERGRVKVAVEDLEAALLSDPPAPAVRDWSETTRRRVVHGLVSALRDFGVLEGEVTKHIAHPRMSFVGFVYVLGRLRDELPSTHEIVAAAAWNWWLLDHSQVRGFLLEADREAVLRFSDAGSTVRIDWRVSGLEEMVRAVV